MPKNKSIVSPKTATHRRNDFRLILFSLIGLFLILSLVVKIQPNLTIDLIVTRFIQQINFAGFDLLMKAVTFLGNPNSAIITIVLFFGLYFLLKQYKISFLFLISSIGAVTISEIVKVIIARPRPNPNLIHQLGTFTRADSFPSGHVLFFIGVYGFLLFLAFTRLKQGLLRIFLIILCLLLLFLIGISRIYLGAHWLTDVLGAYLIGGAWIYLIIYLDQKI